MTEKVKSYYLRHMSDESTIEELLPEDDDGTLDTFIRSEDIPKLRKEWEEELLSDRAVKAAVAFASQAWDEDVPDTRSGIARGTLDAALQALKQESDRG